jgi:hypothetical protein
MIGDIAGFHDSDLKLIFLKGGGGGRKWSFSQAVDGDLNELSGGKREFFSGTRTNVLISGDSSITWVSSHFRGL